MSDLIKALKSKLTLPEDIMRTIGMREESERFAKVYASLVGLVERCENYLGAEEGHPSSVAYFDMQESLTELRESLGEA